MPSKGVVRVVWNQARLVDAIGLSELDVWVVLQRHKDVVPRGLRHVQDAHVDLVNGVMLLGTVRRKELLQVGFVDAIAWLYQKPTGNSVGGRTVENTGQCQRENEHRDYGPRTTDHGPRTTGSPRVLHSSDTLIHFFPSGTAQELAQRNATEPALRNRCAILRFDGNSCCFEGTQSVGVSGSLA